MLIGSTVCNEGSNLTDDHASLNKELEKVLTCDGPARSGPDANIREYECIFRVGHDGGSVELRCVQQGLADAHRDTVLDSPKPNLQPGI